MHQRWRGFRAIAVGGLAAVLAALALPAAGQSAGAQSAPALPACAYGTDVPGLTGYYSSAVEKAADSYAAGLSGSDAATQATARQAFAAAAAAYVYGLPQVTERATIKHFPHNEILSVAALAGPQVTTVVAPNVDTAYTTSWIDLTDGPMVINVPNTGGRFYVLVPPGYTGTIPAGLTRIGSPSNTIWLLGRTLVKDAADLPAVKSLQEQYEATPLAAWESGARQPPVVTDQYPPTIPKSIPSGSEFIATLNNEMNIDPPPSSDDCALQAMAPAGVQIPHPTPAQTLAADSTDEAPPLPAVAGDPTTNAAVSAGTAAAAQIIATADQTLNAFSRGANNGWEILGNWVGAYGTRYLGRAIVATDLLAANTPQQTIYPIADTDVKGRTLSGSYRYIQRDQPATAVQRANWLPAPPGQFHLIMRLYQADSAALSGTWKPAPVLRSDESLASALSRLRIRPRRFRAAHHGGTAGARRGPARVSYTDSLAVRTRFAILAVRHRAHCRAGHGRGRLFTVVVARFSHRDRAGANHLFLNGRAHGRRLRAGRYILRAVAGGTGGIPPSRARTVSFRILR